MVSKLKLGLFGLLMGLASCESQNIENKIENIETRKSITYNSNTNYLIHLNEGSLQLKNIYVENVNEIAKKRGAIGLYEAFSGQKFDPTNQEQFNLFFKNFLKGDEKNPDLITKDNINHLIKNLYAFEKNNYSFPVVSGNKQTYVFDFKSKQ
jgi:hypothetical protein